MRPLSVPLPIGRHRFRAPVCEAFQEMVEPATIAVMTSVDDIPAVCLDEDPMTIFRLTRSDVRFWRKFPECLPFPPLPMLDREIRVSGCVVAWFLAQDGREYSRRFRSPLEELAKAKGNRRNRTPWWVFAPPHAERY